MLAGLGWQRSMEASRQALAAQQEFDLGPRPFATCVGQINHVRVVHFIPTLLRDEAELNARRSVVVEENQALPVERQRVLSEIRNDPVSLSKIDPEFAKQAQKVLDEFWDGDVSIISTTRVAEIFPHSEDELTILLAQDFDGGWKARAALYYESQSSFGSQMIGAYRSSPPANYSGGIRIDQTGYRSYDHDPAIFFRSLRDIVSGRCDRIMARHGILGSGSKSIYFEYPDADQLRKLRDGEPVKISVYSERKAHEK